MSLCAIIPVAGMASANSAFYFGVRGGTGQLFSGDDYGGALYAIEATGADLTTIETFVADRTGVTL